MVLVQVPKIRRLEEERSARGGNMFLRTCMTLGPQAHDSWPWYRGASPHDAGSFIRFTDS
jgi:hypothetical protein